MVTRLHKEKGVMTLKYSLISLPIYSIVNDSTYFYYKDADLIKVMLENFGTLY